ncbi:MAG: hypothetical protein PHP26_11365, partial [Syntrophomonas sp.]|nr:hypothetical protein [Syntrophomonas sp.]
QIILCGGGARLKSMDEYLSVILDCQVQLANLPSILVLPPEIDQERHQEIICEFPLAIGLAGRGVLG